MDFGSSIESSLIMCGLVAVVSVLSAVMLQASRAAYHASPARRRSGR